MIDSRTVRERTVYQPLLGYVSHSNGAEAVRAILAIGAANDERDYALGLILAHRRFWLDRRTAQQRAWQCKVSRRPQRGQHHDSWGLREKYVRCTTAV